MHIKISKQVQIETRFSVAQHALLVLIFVYYFAYLVLFKGSHLELTEPSSDYRLELVTPTKDCSEWSVGCEPNLQRLEDLPYCKQSELPALQKIRCRYCSSSFLQNMHGRGIFLPTKVEHFLRHRDIESDQSFDKEHPRLDSFLYRNGTRQGSLGEPPNQRARPLFKFFVADLERYKLRVGHSLNRNSGDDIASSAMLGFWRRPRRRSDSWNPMDLLNRKPDVAPIKCMNTSTFRCPDGAPIYTFGAAPVGSDPDGHAASSSSALELQRQKPRRGFNRLKHQLASLEPKEADATSTSAPERWEPTKLDFKMPLATQTGDLFSLKLLMDYANVSLDQRMPGENQTIRACGLTLLLSVDYSNHRPWLGLQVTPFSDVNPTYTYHVESLHSPCIGRPLQSVQFAPTDGPNRTTLMEFGVDVIIAQTSTIMVWSTMQAIISLTAFTSLVGLVGILMDYLLRLWFGQRYLDLKIEQRSLSAREDCAQSAES
ncbi:unnamed protein product [Effrenium voratum]|uniref:Uncharacterized protein n=1 Tax=Effrenium voratum TaxID=2562239 RepID=A0AA36J9K1_9DINO|nr:unnamed protein product [Effrenium voratum]CAJ1434567.1 unnamed protein product [Effrenium voratum]